MNNGMRWNRGEGACTPTRSADELLYTYICSVQQKGDSLLSDQYADAR